MRKSFGAKTWLFPCPVVVVASYAGDGKPNMMTAAWCGIVNSNPPSVAVSLREATYSYHALLDREAFTVNIPSQEYLAEADYAGMASGRDSDKFASTGLTPVKSELVDAPYIAEFPVVLECKLVRHDRLGLHTQFIGELLDVKVAETCLNEEGRPDIGKIKPFTYLPSEGAYYSLGERLVSAYTVGKDVPKPKLPLE